jgi:hypothetical protein
VRRQNRWERSRIEQLDEFASLPTCDTCTNTDTFKILVKHLEVSCPPVRKACACTTSSQPRTRDVTNHRSTPHTTHYTLHTGCRYDNRNPRITRSMLPNSQGLYPFSAAPTCLSPSFLRTEKHQRWNSATCHRVCAMGETRIWPRMSVSWHQNSKVYSTPSVWPSVKHCAWFAHFGHEEEVATRPISHDRLH